MTTKLIDLTDRIVTDSGRIVPKHALILQRALNGEAFTNVPTEDHVEIQLYNREAKQPIPLWVDDGILEGLPAGSYDWKLPEPYQTLDVEELVLNLYAASGLSGAAYDQRLAVELTMMLDRDMHGFLRCLIYITQTLRDEGILFGLGRGSSCASLVLFVLGVNRVDPVLYDIQIEEFLK